MLVLAIESTCDETGGAVGRLGENGAVEILADVKASSAEIHAKYGGVIPEIAAREQIAAVIPVIDEAMKQSEIRAEKIDAIAVTEGPGLIGSLLIGVETANALALAWKKPLIGVNHMAAHVFANWIIDQPAGSSLKTLGSIRTRLEEQSLAGGKSLLPKLPAVALIVSGGHTDLMLIRSLTDWEWIGGTRDDAAGEAFDKAARAMGFPYPGGPEIARAAQLADSRQLTAGSLKLPRPMIHEDNLEMSFSGLKTAIVNLIENRQLKMENDENKAILAREFNQAVVDVLVKKTMIAVERYQPRSVLLAGGVAANQLLRQELAVNCQQAAVELFVPELKYCTDNAAMVAACALLRPTYVDPLKLRPNPGLEIR